MQKSRPKQSNALAYLLLTLTMLTWAGNHVVGKWADGHIPPMTLAFLRWTGATLIMLPLAWRSLAAERDMIIANIPRLLLLGMLGSGAFNTLQYLALTETTVANAAILNSWSPVLIALAGAILFADRLRPSQIAGLGISLTGVTTIVLNGSLATLATLSFNRGDAVMLVATAAWAAYTTLLRTRPALSTMSFVAVTYAIASLANLPLAAYEFLGGQHMLSTPEVYLAVLYTATFPSCIAYFFYARGVEIIGATRTGAFIHMVPLFASIMAMAFLGETPQLYHAAGFGLILCGVWLASRR